MKITLTAKQIKESGLDPNSLTILAWLYGGYLEEIKDVFGKDKAIAIRDSLIETPYILSDASTPFTKTILAKSEVEKLLGLRADKINFWEFYNCYPVKTPGGRILRGNAGTQLAEKHEEKYLKKVKTIEQHKKAIAATEAYVAKKKATGFEFMEAIDKVINNSLWETWYELVNTFNTSGRNTPYWNTEAI